MLFEFKRLRKVYEPKILPCCRLFHYPVASQEPLRSPYWWGRARRGLALSSQPQKSRVEIHPEFHACNIKLAAGMPAGLAQGTTFVLLRIQGTYRQVPGHPNPLISKRVCVYIFVFLLKFNIYIHSVPSANHNNGLKLR